MVRETSLAVEDFVYPIFVVAGENVKEEIPSMGNQGCGSGIKAVENDESTVGGGAENHTGNAAEFKAPDLLQNIQPVTWIGLIYGKCLADDINF